MAVYHYDARTLTKSHGDSALGHHDYMCAHGQSQSSKDRIVYTGSGNMPKWAKDEPREYWEATDLYERQNGRLCKSLTIALPQELDLEDNQKLIEEYANHVTTLQNGKRLPFSYAVHADATTGHNPHLHLIISERITDEIDRLPSDHFKRYNSKAVEKGGSQKTDELKPREWLLNQRETWANICNTELEKHGIKAIDHRSLKDRGIDREPNKHLGPRCSKEKKAIEKQLFSLENEIESIKQSISELESQAKNAAVIEMEATHELKSLDRYEKIEAENKAPMLSEQPKALIAIKLREAPMLTEQQAVHSEKIREAPMLSPAKPEAAAGVSRSEKKSDTPRPHHSGGHETVSRTKAEAMIAEMDLRLKKLQKKYNDQAKADQDMANKIYWAEKNLKETRRSLDAAPHKKFLEEQATIAERHVKTAQNEERKAFELLPPKYRKIAEAGGLSKEPEKWGMWEGGGTKVPVREYVAAKNRLERAEEAATRARQQKRSRWDEKEELGQKVAALEGELGRMKPELTQTQAATVKLARELEHEKERLKRWETKADQNWPERVQEREQAKKRQRSRGMGL